MRDVEVPRFKQDSDLSALVVPNWRDYKVRSQTLFFSEKPCSTYVSRLANGVTLVCQETNHRTVVVQTLVEQGPHHERAGREGCPHIFEHLAFTKPKGISQSTHAKKLDQIKAVAQTHFDSVFFGSVVSKEKLGQALSFFKKCLIDQRYDQETLRGQKEAALKEYSESIGEHKMLNRFKDILWTNSSCGRGEYGSQRSIRRVTLDDVHNFSKQICGSRVYIGVRGPINHKDVLQSIKNLYGDLKKGEPRELQRPYSSRSGIYLEPNENEDLISYVIGQQCIHKATRNDIYTKANIREILKREICAGIISDIIIWNHSSESYQEVSRKGDGYDWGGEMANLRGLQYLYAQGSIAPEALNKVLGAFLRSLKRIGTRGLGRKQLEDARENLETEFAEKDDGRKGHILQGVQSMMSYGRYITFEDRQKILRSITNSDIRDYARSHIRWSRFLLYAKGATHDFQPSDAVKRACREGSRRIIKRS